MDNWRYYKSNQNNYILLICSCSGQVLLVEDLHTMLEGVGVVGTGAMTSILISTLQAVGIKVGIDPSEITHPFF